MIKAFSLLLGNSQSGAFILSHQHFGSDNNAMWHFTPCPVLLVVKNELDSKFHMDSSQEPWEIDGWLLFLSYRVERQFKGKKKKGKKNILLLAWGHHCKPVGPRGIRVYNPGLAKPSPSCSEPRDIHCGHSISVLENFFKGNERWVYFRTPD